MPRRLVELDDVGGGIGASVSPRLWTQRKAVKYSSFGSANVHCNRCELLGVGSLHASPGPC